MVRRNHRMLCLMLCLVLALTAVFAGTVSAFAATGSSGETVYVKVNNGWDTSSGIYCYMWTDGSSSNASWPGVEMTNVEDNIYSYTLDGSYAKVIFNRNSNGDGQTSDLTYQGDGYIYDLSAGSWSKYSGATTPTTTADTTAATTAATTEATTAATTTTSEDSENAITVYLDNEAGWSSPYCYMWNSTSDENASWPGEAMTLVGGNIYKYTASENYANVIFSNSGSSQTADLTAADGYMWNNSTSSWSVYDTSPLQVTSYTADPSSGIYTDGDVTLSAEAENSTTGATVSYKFSVTDSDGAISVISDYGSANTVIWTPSTAGDYTVTFDFSDTDGNINSRTLELTVADDSALEKPVIKGITPYVSNCIAVGSETTVNVKAGGGQVGTNLLFYKYVVTDPNGIKNTPYYTLSNSYSFTPSVQGTYTVQVYVQNSSNTTVNKIYSYTAVGSADTTTAATTADVTTTAATEATTTEQATTVATQIKGDANQDDILSILDVTYIQKYLADFDDSPMDNDLKELCDMDEDSYITIKDATCIQKVLAKMTV